VDASLALIISIVAILFVLRLRRNVTLAIVVGAFLLGFLTLEQRSLLVLYSTITSSETIKLVVIIISAFTLGFSMQELGLLEELCSSIESLCGKFSILLLPALVGFLPMPGGALVSAIMINELVKKYQVSPEEATFLNYWCRHLWIPVWPLFPSFILGASIVEVHYLTLIKSGIIVTLPMILASVVFLKSYFVFKTPYKRSLKNLLRAAFSFYPVLMVIMLSLILRVPLVISLPVTIFVLYLHKKPNLSQVKRIFKQTLDWEILLLIIGVLFYKSLIEYTHAAKLFFWHLKGFDIPESFAAFSLAFVIGIAVGIEVGFAAIVLPITVVFTGFAKGFQPLNFALVFAGGFMGIMLSPLHLCLVLSAKYYKAYLPRVYKKLIPAAILVSGFAWLVYFLL